MKRRGFTLVELMAALTLAAGVLLTAQLALGSVGQWRAAITHDAQRVAAGGEGLLALQEFVAMAEASEAGAPRFSGDVGETVFRSRCRSPGGWLEPCDVILKLHRVRDRVELQMNAQGGAWQTVRSLEGAAEFRYLARTDSTIDWRTSWGSNSSRPTAVVLINRADTVVLLGVRP